MRGSKISSSQQQSQRSSSYQIKESAVVQPRRWWALQVSLSVLGLSVKLQSQRIILFGLTSWRTAEVRQQLSKKKNPRSGGTDIQLQLVSLQAEKLWQGFTFSFHCFPCQQTSMHLANKGSSVEPQQPSWARRIQIHTPLTRLQCIPHRGPNQVLSDMLSHLTFQNLCKSVHFTWPISSFSNLPVSNSLPTTT